MSFAPQATTAESMRALIASFQGGVRMDKRHRYTVLHGSKWKRAVAVTTICGCLPKDLCDWAARVQVESDARTALANLDEMTTWSEDEFCARFEARAEKGAWRRVRDSAGDIGGEVHAVIEARVRQMIGEPSEPCSASDEALSIASEWDEWAHEVEFRPVAAEYRVCSADMAVGGTVDCLAYVRGVLECVDWKTSGRIYDDHRIQNVAYRKLGEGLGLPPCPGRLVHIPKDGGRIKDEPADKGEKDAAEMWAIFGMLLCVHRWMAGRKRR